MYKKFIHFCLASLLMVMMTSVSFAEDVYVTKYGKKYHKENSRFIKGKEVTKMTREQAEEKGYEPSRAFLEKEIMDKFPEN